MPDEPHDVSRRALLGRLAVAAGGVLASPAVPAAAPAASAGRLKQSVCRWPYDRIPLPEFCRRARKIGLAAIDLLHIDESAAAANCIAGLAKIAPLAAEHRVTICVELLNSRIDHAGYQGDHTAFGAAVVSGVDSPHVKLLYDIYHMQIMEGDVIRTIRGNIERIGHFHTGGVPGRHEINDSQELNYHAIAAAIADLHFQGYVAHEFVPTRPDPFASLTEAFRVCTV
jgi:hydroxypyruvate isomerase